MEVKELVGKEIMDAYNGNYLSRNFGYSCANFNVRDMYSGGGRNHWMNFENAGFGTGSENDEATFDFYTKNTKNVSCFACYDDKDNICGRRMFFRGESMINDEEFDVPIHMGDEVRYLYGYYGEHSSLYQDAIYDAVMEKYGQGIIYTDKNVLRNGRVDYDIPKFWIMRVEKSNFAKYPPIDFLSISTELRALSNFEPKLYILDILEKDFKVRNIAFHQAYRYNPNKGGRSKYSYQTWDQHKGNINADDLTKEIQVEEEDEEIKRGDTIESDGSKVQYKVISMGDKKVMIQTLDGKHNWPIDKNRLNKDFTKI